MNFKQNIQLLLLGAILVFFNGCGGGKGGGKNVGCEISINVTIGAIATAGTSKVRRGTGSS